MNLLHEIMFLDVFEVKHQFIEKNIIAVKTA